MEIPAEVLDRIRKLMRLAGNNPNANEAALATAKAQELMLRWRLDSATISLDEEPSAEPVEGYYDHEPVGGGKRVASWRARLFTILCNNNACKGIIYRNRAGSELRVIGTRSNVEMVRYLFGYMATEIERLAVDQRPGGMARGEARSWSNEFRHGAVVGVSKTLWEMRQRVETEYKATPAGTAALVIVGRDQDTLDAFVKEHYEGLFRSARASSGSYNNISARRAGESAGRGISINRPVAAGPARRRLGA